MVDHWSKTVEYLRYLSHEKGYKITIKDFVGFLAKEGAIANSIGLYCVHANPYCMNIKTHEHLWDHCQQSNPRMRRKCEQERTYFIGSCYCGVAEFVLPVLYHDQAVGAICIAGFSHDQQRNAMRARGIIHRYNLDASLEQMHADLISIPHPDFKEMATLCGVIADYLALYYSQLVDLGMVQPYEVYPAEAARLYVLSNAIEFIRQHFTEEIHAEDIARFCRCSKSYLSHLFMKSIHVSISNYISSVRINTAKRLILESTSSVKEIAAQCGFNDPNYFSLSFKTHTGMTPTAFRDQTKEGRIKR